MKKNKIIILIILLCISIGIVTAYFIYGSTLVDITNEKSISNHLSADSDNPITILKTAKNGNYFGILYSDPTDGDDLCFHFRSITKAKLYRNKYHNIGISSTSYTIPNDEGQITVDNLNEIDKNTKTAESFLYTFAGNSLKSNKCSVFECNVKDTEIDFEEITDEKQIIEKMQKLADSYKKIDEFDLPNEQIYIIPKNYELSQADNRLSFVNGSVSVEDMKKQKMATADLLVNEFREYMKEAKQ